MYPIQKQLDKKDKERLKQISKKFRQQNKTLKRKEKNRTLQEQIKSHDQKEKSIHRQSSPLRNPPRKDYQIFIPQSKKIKET